jgi:hypothetical protein
MLAARYWPENLNLTHTNTFIMDKIKLKKALIKMEQHTIDEAETNYEEFLSENKIDEDDNLDGDDLSHHTASIDVSNKLDEQLHIHEEHLEALTKISFDPTEVVQPGAVVSVNGRFMVVAFSTPSFKFDGREYLGISVQAPIYPYLRGKKAGDSFQFNGTKFTIEAVH